MESNDERSRQPVIDTDYIDQLLSTYTPAAEDKTEPAEAPAEPAPAAEKPVPKAAVPKKKGYRKPLLILGVIALLGVGFLLGWMLKKATEVPPQGTTSTAPAGTTEAPLAEPGIAPDYTSMSTMELVSQAVRIKGLSNYGSPLSSIFLTPEIYEKIKQANPVLAELEQRPDAAEQLQLFAQCISSLDAIHAANALRSYYVSFLGFEGEIFQPTPECEWVFQVSDQITVYEYTEAPVISFGNVDSDTYSGPVTILNFQGETFTLHGVEGQNMGNCNFWYRIEINDHTLWRTTEDAKLELADDQHSDAWVSACKYGENWGWFVYGCAPVQFRISIQGQQTNSQNYSWNIPIEPFVITEETISSPELAKLLADNVNHIYSIATQNKERDISSYPPLAALLSRNDGISSLLSLAQSSWYTDNDFDYTFSNVLILLDLPCVQERMTEEQLMAIALMRKQGYFHAVSLNGLPALTPPNCIGGYHVGEVPKSLEDIPLTDMNVWIMVSLFPGAQVLRQPDWTLQAQLLSGSDGDTLGVWEWYDSIDGSLAGWIISGKITDPQQVLLRLKQGDTTLELQEVTTLILDTSTGEAT